jgi:hypothetical protein
MATAIWLYGYMANISVTSSYLSKFFAPYATFGSPLFYSHLEVNIDNETRTLRFFVVQELELVSDSRLCLAVMLKSHLYILTSCQE